MNYCILRTEKLGSFAAIRGSAKHTFREIPTPNADPTRTHLNRTIGPDTAKGVCAAIKARLPAKRRKDSVLCIEYLITASPEWFETANNAKQNEYFRRAVEWLYERHGKENVVCINSQNDETSPHVVAYCVPMTRDGRLSAKDFLGGKAKMSQMQTDFAEKVGKHVGLVRGVEGSKAIHTTAKDYAREVKRKALVEPPKQPPAPSLMDRATGKAKKMDEDYKAHWDAYAKALEKTAAEVRLAQKTRRDQAAAISRLRKEVDGLKPYRVEAERLRKEKARLASEMEAQKTFFEKVIAGLKEKLAVAEATIEKLRDQVSGLKDQLRELVARLLPKKAKSP